MVNPFAVNNYVSPEYFCDRKSETKSLKKTLENGINVTLIAHRRFGKSGLLKHLQHHFKQEKKDFVYIDVYGTSNLQEFTQQFGGVVLNELETSSAKALKKITQALASLRPVISFDEFTGAPQVQIDANPKALDENLQLIFNYLDSKGREIVIAIDEFQEVANYPEKKTVALLRTLVQHSKNLRFVFSGSSKHMLIDMFSNIKQPFYQSTQLLELGKIEQKHYQAFITHHLANGNRKMSDEAMALVFHYTRLHTFYVQFLCNRLYQSGKRAIDDKHVRTIMNTILQEQEPIYVNYRNLLPKNQFNLLRAIASEGGVEKLTSAKFLKNHRLPAASSVQAAYKGLVTKEMLLEEEGKHYLQDVFFSLWLAQL